MLLGKRKRFAAEIPSASMADIAFLLLIFFLVTTTIDMDKGIGLVLPPPMEETEQIKIIDKNLLKVLVNDDGEVLLNGEPVQIPDIREIVRRKIAENPKLICSIKTGPGTAYKKYIEVLDQLKQAEARKISIAEPEY